MKGFFDELNQALDQRLTPAVKMIFLINVGITLLAIILGVLTGGVFPAYLAYFLGLYTPTLRYGCIWQFVTYMFIHLQVIHLLMNMWALWIFGPDLENRWGSRRFWRFYLITGAGAGLVHFIVSSLTGFEAMRPLIGASGAIYGLLLVFAAYNPNVVFLVMFAIPMKAKHMALLYGFLVFMSTAAGNEGSVSNLTHLAGLAIAYVYVSLYHREWDIRRWQWR